MKNLIYILLSTLLLVSACVQKQPDGIGEQIVPAPDGFTVTSGGVNFSVPSVDFDKDSIHLQAQFSSVVTVKVLFKGLTSGAIRTMTVTADKLDETNSLWFGEFDSGTNTFFSTGEVAEVEISFYNSNLTYTNTLTITQALSYKNSKNLVLVDPRSTGNNGFEQNISGSWWFDTGTSNSHKGEAITQRRNDINSVQGDYYMELTGQAPAGGAYIGGASYGSFTTGPDNSMGNLFYNLPSNPDSVWFNMYVYGEGESRTDLFVILHEADSGVKSNGDPEDDSHVGGRDDGVQIGQKFNHTGWKLFSYKYSTLGFATYCIPDAGTPGSGAGAGCGTKGYDSDRVKVVSFSLQSEQKALPVSAKVDYCMFTIGGPFDPVKFKR